jgi:hypothetical protein
MTNISYVYPNVTEIQQRGGLLERWQLAKFVGCDYVEVPGDLIKNKTESEATGLRLGDVVTDEHTISVLYRQDSAVPQELKYVLHTEPSLARSDAYGISYQAPLMWHDREWATKFIEMVVAISRFLGKPADAIEIHPGDRRNSFEHVITATESLLDKYGQEFKTKPLMLIENRTGQFISTGKEILGFWQFLCGQHPHLEKSIGVVLDIQQLYTRTKRDFVAEFDAIPAEAIKGLHVHCKHRVPDLSDEIPWRYIFHRVATLREPLIINPEIHHKNRVPDAIKFCRELLSNRRARG